MPLLGGWFLSAIVQAILLTALFGESFLNYNTQTAANTFCCCKFNYFVKFAHNSS